MYSGSENEEGMKPEGMEEKQRDHCFKSITAFKQTPQSWDPALSLVFGPLATLLDHWVFCRS